MPPGPLNPHAEAAKHMLLLLHDSAKESGLLRDCRDMVLLDLQIMFGCCCVILVYDGAA